MRSGNANIVFLSIALFLIAGCAEKPQLMATPNLYVNATSAPFADVPPALQSNHVDVLYVTDRAPEEGSTPEAAKYGRERSRSAAFGVAEVEFGRDVSWAQLVEASTSRQRKVKLDVAVTKTTELCRFPPTPKTLVELPPPAGATQPTTLQAEVDTAKEICLRELKLRLAKSPDKDVYIFVHGVKTEFDSSVRTIAELWHFLGRRGVAVAYSWPAGGKGILRGYDYDYNSSEFTVYHLKQMLSLIASCPEVHRVHVIAHSRGTDSVVSALRELNLEIAASGRSTREVLKLGSVVLAAPDLDIDVVIQRCATARLGKVPERSTIYVCQKDEALGFSHFLFGGLRLGKLQPKMFTTQELAALKATNQVAIIDARVTKPGSYGHNYFYSNPAVSSDVILLLRYHYSPGTANGRPLGTGTSSFWFIDDKYPRSQGPAVAGSAGPILASPSAAGD